MNILNKNINPGHNACAGCGQLSAVQAVMRALDKNTILTNATGCLEVTTTAYPQSAWNLPWIHSLFENASPMASGIRAALKQQGKKDIKVIAQGGDGATYDIGLGLISGMWERNDNVLYICYDTESYSNTGIQASGSTPLGADTTTSPASNCEDQNICPLLPGSKQSKKNMLGIALAHNLKYIAQSTAGFPDDITSKVKKALSINGPAYIQILTPCIPGWNIGLDMAVTMGKLAVQTGLYPLLEYTNGQLTATSKVIKPTPRVEEYLKPQGRFAHLFKNKDYQQYIAEIQKIADDNIQKYNL